MWSRILGRDGLIAGFREVLAQSRMGQGYLFLGPSGVGKRLFARELAKALLCERHEERELQACDQCSSCQLVTAGTHPDLTELSKPEDLQEFPIDLIRKLGQTLSLKPARGRRRITIIDDVDAFNEESGNAFLKTLEEPPPASVLLLLATSREQLLPTIASRCQQISFRPLSHEIVQAIVRRQGAVDEVVLEAAIGLSDGRPGRALELCQPDLWAFRGKLIAACACKPLNSIELARAWIADTEIAGKESAKQRQRASLVLGFLIDFLRRALSQLEGSATQSRGLDDASMLSQFLSWAGEEQIFRLSDRVMEADLQVMRRVPLALVIEALCDAWAKEQLR